MPYLRNSNSNEAKDNISLISAVIYLYIVDNRNTRTMCEIFSKLTIKTLKRRHQLRFGVFIVDFEQISHIVLVPPLLTIDM